MHLGIYGTYVLPSLSPVFCSYICHAIYLLCVYAYVQEQDDSLKASRERKGSEREQKEASWKKRRRKIYIRLDRVQIREKGKQLATKKNPTKKVTTKNCCVLPMTFRCFFYLFSCPLFLHHSDSLRNALSLREGNIHISLASD